MSNVDIDKFELFLDKLSSIVLDSVTNEKVMKIVNDEVYWGGEDPFHNCFSYEEEKEIKEQEEIYNEFLMFVDQRYVEELAEIEEIKREIFMVA
jgi:hypothetical protein